MKPVRSQTQSNRVLGINAGRQRREAEANREEASHDRRAEVFRQDVPHTGNANDPIREERIAAIAAATIEIVKLHSADLKRTKRSIAAELGVHEATVSRVLREVSEGRRDPFTGRLLTRSCGCRAEQRCFNCSPS